MVPSQQVRPKTHTPMFSKHFDENGDKRLPSITVNRFLEEFQGSCQAAVSKVMQLWGLQKDVYDNDGEYSLPEL